MTSVESCDPFASAVTCGTATGMAARSGGPGDMLTFSSLGTTPISAPGWCGGIADTDGVL